MPQVVTHISEAFSFDELSDTAKERARDWYREGRYDDNSSFDCVIEDFATICDILGIDLETHQVQTMGGKTRSEPNIWWSVSYCQGDGACFEGIYSHTEDSCAKIREHCSDEELLRIVDELNRIQSARNLLGKPELQATIKKIDHHYTHENTVSIEVELHPADSVGDEDDPIPEADTVTDLMRDLMRWLHKQLLAEDEYQTSDETVDDNIRANEYMFDEEGSRHAYA